MRLLFLAILLSFTFISCKKEKEKAGEKVEIYLLKSGFTYPGPCKVDEAIAQLDETAFIKNEEILSYSSGKRLFNLAESATEKVKLLMDNVPFAVTVDKEVIYYGIYKPPYSSSSCDLSITMHIGFESPNSIAMQLGYPVLYDDIGFVDKTNDPFLLTTLAAQGKLRP